MNNKCQILRPKCTHIAQRVVSVHHLTKQACTNCAKQVWLSQYNDQVKREVHFDRGNAMSGWAWIYDTEPCPWPNPSDDPRTDEQKEASRRRLARLPITTDWIEWE